MTISIECESCGAELRLADKAAGKRVRCRDCGEPVAVPRRRKRRPPQDEYEYEEDDDGYDEEDDYGYDDEPAPRRRPSGGSGKRSGAGRKKKKKRSRSSSGSIPPVALAIGGGIVALLVVGGVIVALITGPGGPGGDPHEAVAEHSIQNLKQLAGILQSVTDEASARAAISQIEELTTDETEYKRQMAGVEHPGMARHNEIMAKYKPQIDAVSGDIASEILRLRAMPLPRSIIAPALSKFGEVSGFGSFL